MFWGGICFETRTVIVPINRRELNAEYYVEHILDKHVMPFSHFIGDAFLLMRDNERPHVARTIVEYLQDVDVQTMMWLQQSPDMNLIEHLWNRLKRAVRRSHPAPTTFDELTRVLKTSCEGIPKPTS